MLNDTNFVLHGQLEQTEHKILLTGGEGISVQCQNGSLKERFHLVGVDKVHNSRKVPWLGLEEVEHVLVVLNGLRGKAVSREKV